MGNKIRFLKADIFIQYGILLSFIFTAAMPYFLLLSLLLLGFWQIISGFYGAFILGERTHKIYLVGAFSYLVFLYEFEKVGYEIGFLANLSIHAIVPIIIAVWYLRLTKRTLENYQLKGFMIF